MPISKDASPEWWSAFFYSEWLDQNSLLKTDDGDERTHEALVDEFMATREDTNEDHSDTTN